MDSTTARITLLVIIIAMGLSACTGKRMINKEAKVSPITIETGEKQKKLKVLDANGEIRLESSSTIIRDTEEEIVIQTEYQDE